MKNAALDRGSLGASILVAMCFLCPLRILRADQLGWIIEQSYYADADNGSGEVDRTFNSTNDVFPLGTSIHENIHWKDDSTAPPTDAQDGTAISGVPSAPGILRGEVSSFAVVYKGPTDAGAGGTASENIIWLDTYILAGAPVGILVPVRATAVFNSAVGTTVFGSSDNEAEAMMTVGLGAVSIHQTSSISLTNSSISFNRSIDNGVDRSLSFSDIFLIPVGIPLPIEEDLTLISVSASGPGPGVLAAQSAESQDTAWLQLQPMTPGVYVKSDSGYGYGPFSEVPEPGSLALCVVVLAGGLGITRRRRRRIC